MFIYTGARPFSLTHDHYMIMAFEQLDPTFSLSHRHNYRWYLTRQMLRESKTGGGRSAEGHDLTNLSGKT